MKRMASLLALGALTPLAVSAPLPPSRDWPQFGGPARDLRVDASGLAPWGPEGPVTLWERGNPVTTRPSMNMEYGPGPQATPLLFSGRSWTAPTLVGTRLCLRDREKRGALDLAH